MYATIVTAVVSFIGVVSLLFSLPERIKMLIRLPSEAELLFWMVKFLASLKEDLREKVDELISVSDRSKVRSTVATEWFESVDNLHDSIIKSNDSIKRRFDTMKSSWDCLLGICQYCRLVTDVNDYSVKVKEAMEMGKSFKVEDLITDVPEFVRLIKTLGEKVRSFENVKKHLEGTREDLEKKIKALENDGRQRDVRVSAWLSETQECLRSLGKKFTEYRSMIERPCEPASSSSCFSSSVANACVACQDKYNLSKEVERLLDLYNDLCAKGSGFLDNVQNCVGPVLELLVVLRKLEANCNSLESQKKNLENTKDEMEGRVSSAFKSFQQSGMGMERSNEVIRWFHDVESVITASSKASQEWHHIRNEASSPCSPKCSCISEACQACRNKYTLGKEVEGLLQKLQHLEKEANDDHFKDANKLVVQGRLTDVELIPIYSEVFGQEEELEKTLCWERMW